MGWVITSVFILSGGDSMGVLAGAKIFAMLKCEPLK